MEKTFFKYMTVENANKSYRNSLMLANARKDYDIIEDLEYRIKLTEKKVNIIFDTNKKTYKNTHGDYTIN